ncbi:TPA: hypothetical protein ACJG9G_005143 [Salmonella enterica subsp. enterica serovar Java]
MFANRGNVRDHRIIEMFLFCLVSQASVTGYRDDMAQGRAGAEGKVLQSI